MVMIEAGGATDRGRVRARNEDAYHAGTWVFAVADGLGGHPAGDVASLTALQSLIDLERHHVPDDADPEGVRAALVDAVERAHANVRAAAAEDPSRTGMGTTLTAAAVCGGELLLAHVGDSRCYLLREGLQQRSVDHTPVQIEVDAGRMEPEAARHHPGRHVLARAVGLEEDIVVDSRGGTPLEAGDRVLLCSDGLTEMLSDDAIARVLGQDAAAPSLAERLVDEAVRAGGVDNVTTVVLRVLP